MTLIMYQWSAEEETAFKKPIVQRYEHEGHPYFASARLWDDGVIDPLDSRTVLGLSLAAALQAPIQETKENHSDNGRSHSARDG